jgi:enamine deaminase RidA (YjgF/YER057c/UK114 family)
MDMRSRRKFVNGMMMAAAASPMLFAQQGNAPGGAAGPGGGPGGVPGAGRGDHAARVPRPRPAGIVWVSGQGSNDGVPNADHPAKLKVTDPYEDHCRYTMEALKRSIERLGGTMDDFLYMQVFFCLPLDDSTPTPTGSAAAAVYLKCYNAISPIYGSFWTGPHGAPPRSCFALQWIPGGSLLEMVGAAYIDPNAAPATPAPPAVHPGF